MTIQTIPESVMPVLPVRPRCDKEVAPMPEPSGEEIMVHARNLVQKGWSKKCAAKCERGVGIFYLDEKAVSFCIAGAIGRAVDDLMACHSAARRDRRNVDAAVNFMSANNISDIPKWNDKWYRTKGSVMRAFDRAITYCREEDALNV